MFGQVSWLPIFLPAAPSYPKAGQWHNCGFRHGYSRGAAEVSHFLPLTEQFPYVFKSCIPPAGGEVS